MRIGLVGWGVETKSAYEYFGGSHSYVIGNEEPRSDFPNGENIEIHYIDQARQPGLVGNVSDLSYLDFYDNCDLVIFQGAARKNLELKFAADHDFWQKAKTGLDIFFEKSPTKNIIGITGTKGKGTTTSLTAELLSATGLDVRLGGNIGIPVLQMLDTLTPDSWVVLELSNFQLYKFNYSPHIAINLMIIPEHIDEWHKTMKDYVDAKRNLSAHQTSSDISIFLPSNEYSRANAESSPGKLIPYTEPPGAFINNTGFVEIDHQQIIHSSKVGLIGKHNLQNICAALTAAWQIKNAPEIYQQVITNFKGLEHRLQFIREVNGVKYYDDSFGTIPNTAQVALDAFDQPKVVILGGHDKGNDWTELIERLKQEDVKHIVLIGSITFRLLKEMESGGLDMHKVSFRENGNSWTMLSIIDTVNKEASAGDIVLLSTGASSFGLFEDYKDRGRQFAQVVNSLKPA